MEAAGVIDWAILFVTLTSPSVGALSPARVANVPADVVHFKLPPALDTARR